MRVYARLVGGFLAVAGLSAVSVVAGLLAALAVSLYLGRFLNRTISRVAASLQQTAAQTAAGAGQVASTSQSLAEGASEQAASLEETSSSLEEFSSLTKANAANAQRASDLARQARAAADGGAAEMQQMQLAMSEIKASSDDIAKIIKTIDEIAFQTNILALNAAVEAARAGEAGMGFAVVADEVRSLAQRSAHAARETAAKIEGAIAKTGQGAQISARVAEKLQEIVAQARQVDELVAEVAAASKEQSQGVEQVNHAISQMDRVTQANAASAEESASAAAELNAQAESLTGTIAELLRLVQLHGPGVASGHPAATVTRAPKAAGFAPRSSGPHSGNGGERPVFAALPAPAPKGQGSRDPEGFPPFRSAEF